VNPEDTSPPPNLDLFRALAEEHGQSVRREYQWGGEYEYEGETHYVEPGWETILVKEEKIDGRVYCHLMWVGDVELARAWRKQWESLIELNEAGFEHVLSEHGVAR
jgi:hypothetical protein